MNELTIIVSPVIGGGVLTTLASSTVLTKTPRRWWYLVAIVAIIFAGLAVLACSLYQGLYQSTTEFVATASATCTVICSGIAYSMRLRAAKLRLLVAFIALASFAYLTHEVLLFSHPIII